METTHTKFWPDAKVPEGAVYIGSDPVAKDNDPTDFYIVDGTLYWADKTGPGCGGLQTARFHRHNERTCLMPHRDYYDPEKSLCARVSRARHIYGDGRDVSEFDLTLMVPKIHARVWPDGDQLGTMPNVRRVVHVEIPHVPGLLQPDDSRGERLAPRHAGG